jgi:plasmid maintenance system antidote protein VapI
MIEVCQKKISETISKKLKETQVRNPAFSLRALAGRLGISSGALSQVVNNKRRISKKQALKLSDRLRLSPSEKKNFLEPFHIEDVIKTGSIKDATLLHEGGGEPEDRWICLTILNLLKVKSFDFSVKSAAQSMNISEKKVSSALAFMIKEKLVTTNSSGSLERVYQYLRTTDEKPSQFIVRQHLQNLKLSSLALVNQDLSVRDITSMTFPADMEKLAEAKELIRKFQYDLSRLMAFGETTSVYKLNIQLFPVATLDNEPLEGE